MKNKPPFYLLDGKKYVTVTTVLSVIAKPALVGWAAKEASAAALEFATKEWDRTSEITIEDVTKWKKAHRTKADKALDIGTEMHALMDAVMTGAAYDEAALVKAAGEEVAANLIRAAKQATADLGLKLVLTGQTVRNEECGYAGTFDAIVSDKNGSLWLTDYKTSKGIYDEMHLQTAAYLEAAWTEGLLDQIDSEEYIARAILRLDKATGAYEWVERAEQYTDDLLAFKSALTLYNWLTRDAAWRKTDVPF